MLSMAQLKMNQFVHQHLPAKEGGLTQKVKAKGNTLLC
jgi:hypothetical protein